MYSHYRSFFSKNLSRPIVSFALLTLAEFAAPALAVPASAAQSALPPVKVTTTQKKVNLSPIVVNGQHFSFVATLQLIKKGLTRVWSGNPADANKLVCQWYRPVGTHFQYLRCQTNQQHQKQARETQIGWGNAYRDHAGCVLCGLESGEVPVVIAGVTTKHKLPRSSLAPLLAKLPPANASYTLRVTGKDHRPVLDYVFKKGDLVRIREYVYKKKAKSARPKKGQSRKP
ncbi:MAG: hypothetical protein ACRESR_06195 [Gammaproteobacteria bacterium]